jgi:cytochrome c oxidase assembly protein subunit 15
MTSFLRSDRSRPVAIWLLVVAALVLAMIVVGGATRLTDSGLSITEWRPVTGVVPPLSQADWDAAFAEYRKIPQYAQVNAGMSLPAFKTIYWWEWTHRLLGRIVGAAFLIPFVVFLVRGEVPRRLIWRCVGLFALGGLQGLVGWWMVASGLDHRISVAPERLMVHLGLAFALFGALIWTALDAWSGAARQTLPSPWGRRSAWLIALVYVQILLGALVAGNDAGLIYNDWPLMNGRLWPKDYFGPGFWATLAHSQAAVQANHRLVGYITVIAGLALAIGARRSNYLSPQAKILAAGVGAAVLAQAALGVATLMARVPVVLGLAHQLAAAGVLAAVVAFGWRVRRV